MINAAEIIEIVKTRHAAGTRKLRVIVYKQENGRRKVSCITEFFCKHAILPLEDIAGYAAKYWTDPEITSFEVQDMKDLGMNTTNLAYKAMLFAREVHKDQRRKYTGNPYVDHLAEVAGIVATVAHEYSLPPGYMLATAWLHDCVEDQGVEMDALFELFGWGVAHGVMALSDLELGNRAQRKAASRDRLAAAPSWVQTIKCADLISNTSSIVQHDPKFAEVYLEEKRLLLAVMTEAHAGLRQLAMEQVGS